MYTCSMGLFCQENEERSVLLPVNMTSCQMSLKIISPLVVRNLNWYLSVSISLKVWKIVHA